MSNTILKQINWHSLSHQGLLSLLEVNAQKGLSAQEVLERRKVYGFNRISQKGGVNDVPALVVPLRDFRLILKRL